ncbi:MAG TPA: hypothetical protein PLE67_03665 [Tenuifilaceae bacterium]|nr:hypothetical protein [Tenuifilaceae bacterium]
MTEKKINYDKSIELVKISSEYTTFYMDKLNSLKAGFMFCYIFGGLISAFAIFFYLIAEDPGTSELIIPGSSLLLITMGILLHLKYKGKSYQRKKAEPLRTALAEMASVFYDVVKKLELLKCTYFHKDLIPVSKKSEEDFTIPLSSFSHEEFVQNMVLRLNDKTFIDGSLMGWSFKCK